MENNILERRFNQDVPLIRRKDESNSDFFKRTERFYANPFSKYIKLEYGDSQDISIAVDRELQHEIGLAVGQAGFRLDNFNEDDIKLLSKFLVAVGDAIHNPVEISNSSTSCTTLDEYIDELSYAVTHVRKILEKGKSLNNDNLAAYTQALSMIRPIDEIADIATRRGK